MCEPNLVIYYICIVLICFICSVYYSIIVSIVLLLSPMYSLCGMVVSSMKSGRVVGWREGGVFTYDRPLSAGFNKRFWKVSKVWQITSVGREKQQTIVSGCEDLEEKSINRAGKCWNLTGTGTCVCCYYLPWPV